MRRRKDRGEHGVGDEHCEERLHDRSCCRLADTFRTTFHVETGIAGDSDNDPREDRAFDHARIQIPRIRTLERAEHVAGGIEIERKMAHGPAAENANVISQDREGRQHHEHREEAGHNQVADRIDRHHFERLDFLGHFHRSQLCCHGRPAATDHDHGDQDRTHLSQERDHHQVGNVNLRTELFQRMRGLHCQRHPNAERGERDHRRRADANEHHLPEDRR